MKVLCLSLLRLGDIFMQIPLYQELKKRGNSVHLLVNKQFSASESFLLRFVDRVFYFDREFYQQSCGEAQFNLMSGYQQIGQLIELLNVESYECIYNFTNTRLSAVLMGAIRASEKKGYQYTNDRFQSHSSAWLDYLNTHFSFPHGSLFHYTEILGNAFEIPISPAPVRKRLNRREPLILLQCFTSDAKKNWPLIQFQILAQTLQIKYPMALIRVLATPQESVDLKKYFSDEEIWIADIEMSFELLKQADLFIGLDTSIKHLAVLARTPVVEINLGSSDTQKTGAFLQQRTAWASSIACAPCSHEQKCLQVSHKCSESLEVSTILHLAEKSLRGESQQRSSEEWADRIIWEKYLFKNNIDLYEAGMHLKLGQNYLQNTMHLAKWQQRLEMALSRNNRLAQSKEINKNDIAEFMAIAKEILSSKLDRGSYFLRMIDTLLWANHDGSQFFQQAQKAIRESGELVQLRKEIIKGNKDARVSSKTIREGFGSIANG